jgi:tripartite-type tricarboxylate transporter receptor subunit TctC
MGRTGKRWIRRVVLTGALFSLPFFAQAADFPDKPITLIVPFQAGGATDVVIRPLAEAARKHLGQPVMVENRAGGGGAVGVGSIVGKRPDGYLLSVVSPAVHRNSYLNKLPFDTVRDLTPIIRVAGYLYGIVVRSDSPHGTLRDLVEYARANPDKVTYMASGVGTGGHVALEELAFHAGGLKFVHIPSKGDAESATALLGGHVDVNSTPSGWIPLVEAGKIRILATFGEKRNKRFSNIPTALELGYKTVQEAPIGIVGPKGMPREIAKALHDGFRKALDDPGYLAAMAKFEMPVLYQNTDEFTRYWADSFTEEGEIVKRYIKK